MESVAIGVPAANSSDQVFDEWISGAARELCDAGNWFYTSVKQTAEPSDHKASSDENFKVLWPRQRLRLQIVVSSSTRIPLVYVESDTGVLLGHLNAKRSQQVSQDSQMGYNFLAVVCRWFSPIPKDSPGLVIVVLRLHRDWETSDWAVTHRLYGR